MMQFPNASEGFSPDLAPLLAPLSEADPVGESLRYAGVYAQIKDARFEEDPTLPMGDWTRPLKKADWRAVESLCVEVLTKSSKDLQVAGWLTEAWIRRHGLPGLLAGAKLLQGLVTAFWADIHPRMEDGDSELRAAPFAWMNDALAQTVLLHVPLMPWPEAVPPVICLYDWQKAVAAEFGSGAAERQPGSVTSRQELLKEAVHHVDALVVVDSIAQEAVHEWDQLSDLLNAQMGSDAPSVSKVSSTLEALQQAVRSLLQDNDPRSVLADEPAVFEEPWAEGTAPAFTEEYSENAMIETSTEATSPVSGTSLATSGKVGSREEAYRLLELAAAYLEKTEPHSPTPYLIKRAITWGRLPLPELMQEVIKEEGDISRYFSLLGIRSY